MFKLFTMHALVVSLVSCNTAVHQSYLSGEQIALLDKPESEHMTFNENGNPLVLTAGKSERNVYHQENIKGNYYAPCSEFNGELGKLPYTLPNGNTKLYIELYSENLYRPVSGKAQQTIYLYDEADNDTSKCDIDFANKLASKEIGGVTYTQVVIGVDRDKQDTVYWKKGLGVLGWKKNNENYTVYRVD